MFDKKTTGCEKCLFYRKPFVPAEGSLNAEAVFIGDSPWKTEVDRGRPFIGPAGDILDILFEEYDFERRDIFLINSVMCKPDELGQTIPKEVTELCGKLFLSRALKKIKPKIVVPMGNAALKAIGETANIGRVRGLLKELDYQGNHLKIIPTFHPSLILRKPAYLPYASQDFEAIRYFLDNERQKPENSNLNYISVTTNRNFEEFLNLVSKTRVISWDLETTGLDYRTDLVLTFGFSFRSHTAHIVPFYKLPYIEYDGEKFLKFNNKKTLKIFYDILHDKSHIFLFHNGKFDLRMMNAFFKRELGFGIQIDSINWYDTQAMYGLLDENTWQNLKEVSRIHTDLRYSSEELATVKGGQMKRTSLEKMTAYNGKDCDGTRRIGLKFHKELLKEDLWKIYAEHTASDMKIANVLFKMELFGAPIDKTKIQNLELFMQQKLHYYQRRMEKVIGREFNPNSDPQLREILFKDLKFPIPDKKTKGGQISTDKEVIGGLIEQFPKNKFLKYFRFHRNYTSIEETFVRGFEKKLDVDGRLHPDFGFTRTVSGRIVCYKPNLANIPRDKEFEEGVFVSIRSLFAVPESKKIIYADASQIEFKTAAVLSGDKRIIKELFEDRADFHTLVARALYKKYKETEILYKENIEKISDKRLSSGLREKLDNQIKSYEVVLKTGRTRAKNYNFGRIYGAQLPTLAAAIGTTIERVDEFENRLIRRYPRFEKFIRETPKMAVRDMELTSPYGRKRRFPPTPDERVQEEQGRQGGNFLPQSSAAYIVRAALVNIAHAFERVGMGSYPFNIVYDAILVESPNDEVKDAAEIIASSMLAPVPELKNHVFSIELGIGQDWQEGEHKAKKLYSLDDLSAIFT